MRREKLDEEFTNLKKTSNLPSGYPTILIVVVVQVAGVGKPRHTVPPPALSPEHAPTRPVQRKRGEEKKKGGRPDSNCKPLETKKNCLAHLCEACHP